MNPDGMKPMVKVTKEKWPLPIFRKASLSLTILELIFLPPTADKPEFANIESEITFYVKIIPLDIRVELWRKTLIIEQHIQ